MLDRVAESLRGTEAPRIGHREQQTYQSTVLLKVSCRERTVSVGDTQWLLAVSCNAAAAAGTRVAAAVSGANQQRKISK